MTRIMIRYNTCIESLPLGRCKDLSPGRYENFAGSPKTILSLQQLHRKPRPREVRGPQPRVVRGLRRLHKNYTFAAAAASIASPLGSARASTPGGTRTSSARQKLYFRCTSCIESLRLGRCEDLSLGRYQNFVGVTKSILSLQQLHRKPRPREVRGPQPREVRGPRRLDQNYTFDAAAASEASASGGARTSASGGARTSSAKRKLYVRYSSCIEGLRPGHWASKRVGAAYDT